MSPEFQREALLLLEAVNGRVTGADRELGVTIDHGAAEALQALLGALDGTPGAGAYLLTIAREVLAELPAPAPFGAFVAEFRRRAGSERSEPDDGQNVSRFGTR